MTARFVRRVLPVAALFVLLAAGDALALSNGLARTPPMGWNPWYSFRCRVDERLIRETADAMVSSGMAAAGYRYVNLDDCWMARRRDGNGRLQGDLARFPSGIRALADYVHSKGLRFGIYQSPGARTCAGYPGMRGHYLTDVRTFAAWRVDYLKIDWCRASAERHAPAIYANLRRVVRSSHRPMVMSISNWGRQQPWIWGPRVGHLWRITGDISPRRAWPLVLGVVDKNNRLRSYARPGAWNDPDILQVGNGHLTETEQRSIFSLWAVMAAPLLAGNDVRTMSDSTRAILANREVVSVDQDRLGVQGRRLLSSRGREVWSKPLVGGGRAVVLLNRRPGQALLSFDVRRLWKGRASRYRVRDLWEHRTGVTGGYLHVRVPRHGVAMFRVHPVGRLRLARPRRG